MVQEASKKYKVEHDREVCIGCSACSSVSPKFWKMNERDGKSDLVGSLEKEGVFNLMISEESFEINKDAAESCPVNCIHLYDDNKKLI